jgi:hypothetical protein
MINGGFLSDNYINTNLYSMSMSTGDPSKIIERYKSRAQMRKYILNFGISICVVLTIILMFLTTIFGIPNELYALELNEMELTSIDNITHSNETGEEVKIYGFIESNHNTVISGDNTGRGFKGEVFDFVLNDTTSIITVEFREDLDLYKINVYRSAHDDSSEKEFRNGDWICVIGEIAGEGSNLTINPESISDEPDNFYKPFLDNSDNIFGYFLWAFLLIFGIIFIKHINYSYTLSTTWNSNRTTKTFILFVVSFVIFLLFIITLIQYIFIPNDFNRDSSILIFIVFLCPFLLANITNIKDSTIEHHHRFIFTNDKSYDKYYKMGKAMEEILDKRGLNHTRFDKKSLGLKVKNKKLIIQLSSPSRRYGCIRLTIKPVTNENRDTIVEPLKKEFDSEFNSDKWLE